LKYHRQRKQIDRGENVLRKHDIPALVRPRIEMLVDPDVRARIHQRPRVARYVCVVALAF